MDSSMIRKDLIQLDMDAKDQKDFFEKICKILVDEGCVKNTYLEALMGREKEYPTGLPTQPYAIAIPHADPQHLIKPFVAPIRLKNEIDWCEMATSDVWHKIRLIFVLGFTKGDGHIEMLQLLVDNLQDKKLMDELLNAKSIDEYYETILSINGFD